MGQDGPFPHLSLPARPHTATQGNTDFMQRDTGTSRHTQIRIDTYTGDHTLKAKNIHPAPDTDRHTQRHGDSDTQAHAGTQTNVHTKSGPHGRMCRCAQTHTSPLGMLKETRNKEMPPHLHKHSLTQRYKHLNVCLSSPKRPGNHTHTGQDTL